MFSNLWNGTRKDKTFYQMYWGTGIIIKDENRYVLAEVNAFNTIFLALTLSSVSSLQLREGILFTTRGYQISTLNYIYTMYNSLLKHWNSKSMEGHFMLSNL